MAPGGARGRSGPAPDPNALRRNRKDDSDSWVTLPAEGREGRPPEFPLPEQTVREDRLWHDLWSKPQAIMWEHLGLVYQVALLTRRMGEAEQHGSGPGVSTLVKQISEDLGLTVGGMRSNRWTIGEPVAGSGAPSQHGNRGSAQERRLQVAK